MTDPTAIPSHELAEIAAARWVLLARDEQLEPDGEWGTWYIIGGRGSGKTRCGSETLAQWILDSPAGDWAIVAPTFGDARDVCTEGPSGLLVALGANPMGQGGHVTNYNRSYGEIYVDNGSMVYLDGADDGALRVQGKNLRGSWCDEVGLWRNWDTAWNESLAFAIRLDPGKIVATGTPKQGHPLVRSLIKDDRVVKTHMRMTDNLANLLPSRVQELRDKYEGTRRGRQELEGEFLEDVEGALWTAELLDKTRLDDHPGDLHRVVVAVDPAGSSKQSANAAGIVVVGRSKSTGHGYVIADYTLNAPPEQWGRKVIEAYHAHDADSVVAESNYGGDIVKAMLQLIDQRVPVRMVNATRGKRLRAEPISMLYEQGKAHHVGVFPELEEEQTMWTPDAAESPNRLDALVWGLTAVMLSARGASQDEYRPSSRAPVVQRGDLRLVGKRYVDQGR